MFFLKRETFIFNEMAHTVGYAFLCKFCQISAKFWLKIGEIWLKIGEIWLNPSSQKIPGLFSYAYLTVINSWLLFQKFLNIFSDNHIFGVFFTHFLMISMLIGLNQKSDFFLLHVKKSALQSYVQSMLYWSIYWS